MPADPTMMELLRRVAEIRRSQFERAARLSQSDAGSLEEVEEAEIAMLEAKIALADEARRP